MGKNFIIFGADMSSSMHIDNKNKDILILGETPTQGLDDTTLTADAKCFINFTQPINRFVLSLHYNESNSFLFVSILISKTILFIPQKMFQSIHTSSPVAKNIIKTLNIL